MPADRNIEKQKVAIYATAILQRAGDDRDKIIEYDGELRQVVEAFYFNGDMRQAFADESIDADTRAKIAANVFAPFDKGLGNVLTMMASRGDIELVSRVAEEYTLQAEKALGSVIVDVYTVVELDDHLRDVISKKLSDDFGVPVVIREHIDSKIIGGIIMSAHGKRIDASIASQLESSRIALSNSPTGGDR